MRDKMYQEALLLAIDEIDNTRLYAEYEVLTALGESYIKSAMMIQEATTADETPAEPPKEAGDKKKWYQHVWEFIKKIAGKIATFFKKLPGRIAAFIKSIPSKMKNLAIKGGIKAGKIIASIQGVGHIKYIGETIGENEVAKFSEVCKPINFEVTLDFDPVLAEEVLRQIGNEAFAGGDVAITEVQNNFVAMIQSNIPKFKQTFKKSTINMGKFEKLSDEIARECASLQRTCDRIRKADFVASNDALTDKEKAKVGKFMEKSWPEIVKALNELMTYTTKVSAKSARVVELMDASHTKFMEKNATKMEKAQVDDWKNKMNQGEE